MNKVAAYQTVLSHSPMWSGSDLLKLAEDMVPTSELIKLSSADEVEVYEYFVKVAEYGTQDEVEFLLSQAYEAGLDKEGGLMARGLTALGGALNRAAGKTHLGFLNNAGRRASMAGFNRATTALESGGLRALQNEDALKAIAAQAKGQVESSASLSRGLASLRNRAPAQPFGSAMPVGRGSAAGVIRQQLPNAQRQALNAQTFGPNVAQEKYLLGRMSPQAAAAPAAASAGAGSPATGFLERLRSVRPASSSRYGTMGFAY